MKRKKSPMSSARRLKRTAARAITAKVGPGKKYLNMIAFPIVDNTGNKCKYGRFKNVYAKNW